MADAPYLEIKDWKKHQHYRDRRPPWIKLYGALLDDVAFLALPEIAQAQLIKLWILASRMSHPLPFDRRLLAGKLFTKRLMLEPLIEAGFLIPSHASAVLAEPEQNARPLSTEVEIEREDREQFYKQGERRNGQRVGVLEAGELIDEILALKTSPPAGQPSIPLPSLEAAFGPAVVRAYKAVGGARTFLATPPDKRSYLIHQFAEALSEARGA